jgi:hypothetical protein
LPPLIPSTLISDGSKPASIISIQLCKDSKGL